MSLNDIHGFDQMFDRLLDQFPEFKLHVREANGKVFVSAAAGDANAPAICTGPVNDQLGALVRQAVCGLFARQVAAQATNVAQNANRVAVIALLSERNSLSDRLADLEDEICDLEDFTGLTASEVVAQASALQGRLISRTVVNRRLTAISDELAQLDPEYDIRDSL